MKTLFLPQPEDACRRIFECHGDGPGSPGLRAVHTAWTDKIFDPEGRKGSERGLVYGAA